VHGQTGRETVLYNKQFDKSYDTMRHIRSGENACLK